MGSRISADLAEGGIALFFCSEYRGTRLATAAPAEFSSVREQFYRLSALDFEVPICDLGDLVSGKTAEDTHYIIEEIVAACLQKHTLPLVVGGGSGLAYSLFTALNHYQKEIVYAQISGVISLVNSGEAVTEDNFLAKILGHKSSGVKNYHHLGYQKHLNEPESVKLLNDVDFDVVRLAEMMHSTEATEPYFRKADLVTINCDAVEGFAEPFSVNPQVNGLNRREICAYAKEAGLGENLKAAGIFNYNPRAQNALHHQLLAQMIWHLVEGINIQRSHPKERQYETFWVLIDGREYAFKRDTFSDLWYFGGSGAAELFVPCSRSEFEQAKRGAVARRLLRYQG